MKQAKFDLQKAVQAINYFVNKYPELSQDKIKVIKLLWAADKYHLLKYGRPLTGDRYYAMNLGPVLSRVKDVIDGKDPASKGVIEQLSKNVVKSISPVDMDEFSDSDVEALEFAINKFGKLGSFVFAERTHDYPEWKKHEEELKDKNVKRVAMDYLDFFEASTLSNDPFSEIKPEVRNASKEIFIESLDTLSLLS